MKQGWEDRGIRLLSMALVALVPLLYSPFFHRAKEAAASLLISLLVGVSLVRLGKGGVPFRWGGLGLPFLSFLASAALSLGGALRPWEGLKSLSFFALLFFFYLILVNGPYDRESVPGLFETAVLAGTLAALAGILQFSMPGRWGSQGEPVATMGNTNYAGGYFITVLPLAIALFFFEERRGVRLLFLSSSILITLALILTKARGAWVGMLGGLVLMGHRLTRTGKGHAWGWGVFFVLGGLGEILLRLKGGSILQVVASIFDPHYPTNAWRLIWWGDTLRMIRDHPFLGVGWGNFSYAYFPYASLARLGPGAEDLALEHPHNEYLGILAEGGLLGFGTFLWLFLAAVGSARQAGRTVRGRGSALVTGLVGSLAAASIHGFFMYNFHEPGTAINLWMVLAGLEVLSRSDPPVPSLSLAKGFPPVAASFLLLGSMGASFFLFGVRPLMADHYLQRAMNPWSFSRKDAPIPNFFRSLAWEEGFPAHFELGKILYRLSLFEQAALHFRRAVELNPYHLGARNNLASALWKMGRAAEAKALYQEVLRINPAFWTAYNNLGNVLLEEGDYWGAIRQYRAALVLNPRYADAFYNLGVAYMLLSRPLGALLAFEQAVELNPSMAEAWYNLAVVRASRGEGEASLLALRRAVALNHHLAQRAKEDAALKGLDKDLRFRRLVGRP